jgi:hypothetical protein
VLNIFAAFFPAAFLRRQTRKSKTDVVMHCEPRKQAMLLENHATVQVRPGEVLAVEKNCTLIFRFS